MSEPKNLSPRPGEKMMKAGCALMVMGVLGSILLFVGFSFIIAILGLIFGT